MPLSKQRKAVLDSHCLEFNRWATKVLEHIHDSYPLAQVTMRQLMQFYILDLHYKIVARHIIKKYRSKTGM